MSWKSLLPPSSSSSSRSDVAPGAAAAAPCPFDEAVLSLVRFGCSCGNAQPVARLYFCRHCADLRCGFCVSHEVDSHYCPNCLENMPSAEARLKKNRCANCFDCPGCGHALSTRATSVAAPAPQTEEQPGGKVVPKKIYYLCCGFCRWTSRDVGLADQTVASGGWPEAENAHAPRVATLLEHYRALAQKEKIEKDNKRFAGRRLSYMQLSDKYGLTTIMARKRAGLPPLQNLSVKDVGASGVGGEACGPAVAPAQPTGIEDDDRLPSDLFDVAPDLCKMTTLPQRLSQVDTQPSASSAVVPRHIHLMIKRSQRCRRCEHNLSKPEYNPTSIKFKIQLAAHYHVPDIVVYRFPEQLRAGRASSFMLKIVNPTQHPTQIQFLTLDDWKVHAAKKAEDETRFRDDPERVRSATALLRQPSIVTASERIHGVRTNAQATLPAAGVKISLAARDDAAEFDEASPGETRSAAADDKSVVAWRKGNKVGVILGAIPDAAVGSAGAAVGSADDVVVVVGFAVKFVYTNTVAALEHREVKTADIVMPVYVKLGKLNVSD